MPDLESFTSVAACGNFSLGLKADGTVWAWGANQSGQLGDSTNTLRFSPVSVANLSGIKAISCAGSHSLALKEDGTVWAWGFNQSGQLGDGTSTSSNVPVQVSGLDGVTAIGAGNNHSLACKSDGTAWTWGGNGSGQIGDGTTTPRSTPVRVSGIQGVKAVAGGNLHSLALLSDGTVWGWGSNAGGQLGDGTTTVRMTPVQVRTLTGITAIEAGDAFSIALKDDGTAWTWGANGAGQLGDGTNIARNSPVQVAGLTDVAEVTAGGNFALALRRGGIVVGWGSSSLGALGNGEFAADAIASPIENLRGVTAVTAGGAGHGLALRNDGTVWAWGNNNFGQLGIAQNIGASPLPREVSGLSQSQSIGAGNQHSLAVMTGGSAWTWGQNNVGQLGDGTQTQRNSPVQVSMLSGITAVAGGNTHSLALKDDGTVWAWGGNGNGQLGDGTQMQRLTPVRVVELSGVKAIACGATHSVALRNDGTVWTWGANNLGQLGYTTEADRLTPAQVPGLTGVVSIASSSGAFHTLALKDDGSVWAWGRNARGQLGNGEASLLVSSTLSQVTGIAGVASIAAGNAHSIAVTRDGTVWTWGFNAQYQLGNFSLADIYSPARAVFVMGGPMAGASASNYSMVVGRDGTVQTWGPAGAGQLGRETDSGPGSQNRFVPAALGAADLKITSTHDRPFVAGGQGIYRLTVTNLGDAPVEREVVFLDLLPVGLTYVAATGDGWTCQPPARVFEEVPTEFVSCTNRGPILPASSSFLTLTVRIGAAALPSVTNAVGFPQSYDLNRLNDRDGDVTAIVMPANAAAPLGKKAAEHDSTAASGRK